MGLEQYKSTQLSAVTTDTTGTAVSTEDWNIIKAWINVSVNTGAVTVTIEGSYDNSTFFTMDEKTYTATTGKDMFVYAGDHYPYTRIKTSTQSNSTVTAVLTGRGI